MNKKLFREMELRERRLVHRLLEPAFPGRNELREQLETARVRVVDDDGCLEFSITSSTEARQAKYAVPSEGEYEDADGITVHVLLHMVRGKAKELEFFREDGGRVKTWPDPDTLRVFAPD